MHYYNNTVGIIIFYNYNSLEKNIKVIFYDFVMKCVYKSTIYTFVIQDKIWTLDTPTLLYKSIHVTFVFWVPKTTPTSYMSGTFVLAPPPPGAFEGLSLNIFGIRRKSARNTRTFTQNATYLTARSTTLCKRSS